MNKKRTVVLSVGFLSLAIFALIVMVMLYLKNSDAADTAEKRVAAYVAAKNIAAGQKIALDDIELKSFPADYAGNDPLPMAQIVERYASVAIMKNDLIGTEKLTATLPPLQDTDANHSANTPPAEIVHDAVHDVISVPLHVFKNPDTSLRRGERIDILGIADYGEEKRQFATRYLAVRVGVAGFMKNGKKSDGIVSVTVDEKTKAETKVLADEILLDMPPQDIGRFLSLYYRSQELNNDRSHNRGNLNQGHIWMVKSNPEIPEGEEAAKVKMMSPSYTPPRPKPHSSQPVRPMPPLVSVPKGIVTYEQ
ncbi:MAG: SAF domain-containing protein [Campylobacterales bacterium]|nr:SAF domain-containing protein [Campylobacterales bacterium]